MKSLFLKGEYMEKLTKFGTMAFVIVGGLLLISAQVLFAPRGSGQGGSRGGASVSTRSSGGAARASTAMRSGTRARTNGDRRGMRYEGGYNSGYSDCPVGYIYDPAVEDCIPVI